MNKKVYLLLSSFILLLGSCGTSSGSQTIYIASIENAGFESDSLNGWASEGTSFSETDLSESDKTKEGVLNQHNGRYYLDGSLAPSGSTGSLSSSSFKVTKNGYVSFLMAGGKNKELCYVAFCDRQSGEELYKASNDFFVEGVTPSTSLTDNFARIIVDLSQFMDREIFIKAIDNDTSGDFDYISLDDFDVDVSSTDYFIYLADQKSRKKTATAEIADNEFQVKNGGFDTGDLTGWASISGDAFPPESIDSANSNSLINNMDIPYNNDGYFLNGFNIADGHVGVLRSSVFTVGGIGMMSIKLGGGSEGRLNYVSIKEVIDDGADVEIARLYNQKFCNYANFKYSEVGTTLFLQNMVNYDYDLSAYMGKKLYFEIVDKGTSNWGLLCVDSIVTYYTDKSALTGCTHAINILPIDEESSIYQIPNGGFEHGDTKGWKTTGSSFNDVSTIEKFWAEQIHVNKDGNYCISAYYNENMTGTLTSSDFLLGGTGWISFKLGGGPTISQCYISVMKAEDDSEVARFGNTAFTLKNFPSASLGMRMFNMQQYSYDLSAYLGQNLYFRIVDECSSIHL
jgi:fructan beta-fructosidase